MYGSHVIPQDLITVALFLANFTSDSIMNISWFGGTGSFMGFCDCPRHHNLFTILTIMASILAM